MKTEQKHLSLDFSNRQELTVGLGICLAMNERSAIARINGGSVPKPL